MRTTAFVSLAILALTGCVSDDDPHTSELGQHVTSDNGISLNGISLNGISLNGVSLNGISLNGVSLNGISLNGISLNGISLNGISLNGIALNGSTWTGTLSNGAPLALRIDSATQGSGANSDVGMYAVSYSTANGWSPLCGTDSSGQPVLALAVAGQWNQTTGAYTDDASTFSFACRGKSIAKCVELGYKPWSGYTDQLTSCVRMLRGDYCGDGTPHTADGTLLNLYDNAGVQADTEAWKIEAEWTPDGARCIAKDKDTRFYQALGEARPACLNTRIDNLCGKSFAAGAVIISELPQ